jgi:hypothetical protein
MESPIEHLTAVLSQPGARYVYGLSSGAIVILEEHEDPNHPVVAVATCPIEELSARRTAPRPRPRTEATARWAVADPSNN